MENASKALIIAGAILLAIVIVSLGMVIFSQAQEVAKGANLSEAEITAFNNKYTQHEGENVRGSNVNSLISSVITNNQTAINADEDNKLINLTVTGSNIVLTTGTKNGKTYITGVTTKAQSGKVYKVSVTSYGTTGLVNSITISNPR